MTEIKRNQKKEQIIKTAFQLFKENGFYATGVDLIMREACISKRTLYKYFRTKNELVVAVIEHYHSEYKAHMNELIDIDKKDARENIHAIFNDAKSWFNNINFHGCLAVNAMGEFAGKDISIEKSCKQFKEWEIGLLTNLCKQLDDQSPSKLAYKLFVLLEGMSSVAQVTNNSHDVNMTDMANEVIDHHLSSINN